MAKTFEDYMVVMAPKKAFAGQRRVVAMVVIASSQADAIRTAQTRWGGAMVPDSSYKKPQAWPIAYGRPYYLS